MNIIIRADSSTAIGTGHIMRCLSLADKLRTQDNNISFICREESGNIIGLIQQKGYDVQLLPPGINIETDRELTKKMLEQTSPDWLIVDHYDIDAAWESSMRNTAGKIMVVDDLANRAHDCDILLDQNIATNGARYGKLTPDKCIRLLGPQNALLRPQFVQARNKLKKRTGITKRILIFMGGSDPDNETSKVLHAIKGLGKAELVTDIVIGSSNIYRDEVESLALTIPNAACHYNVENMADLMACADLCIGASGTASWERCCVGLPSIVISIASNQIEISEALAAEGCAVNLGWHEDIDIEKIRSCLEELINEPARLNMMSEKCMTLVNGLGSQKVSDSLLNNK